MIYSFVVVRNGADIARFQTVDEAFRHKQSRGRDGKELGDFVFVELGSTKYRATVLRPG